MRELPLFLLLSFVLAQQRAAVPNPPAFRIRGVVVDAITHQPVARASVVLFRDQDELISAAGDDGAFAFDGLLPGKYPLTAVAPGYLRELYLAHDRYYSSVVVGPGLDSEHLVFPLHRQGVIQGKITDDRGEPVRGAQVHLYLASVAYGIRGELLRPTHTDDLGAFRFAHLRAGKYVIVVRARPWYAQTRFQHLPRTAQQGMLGGIIPLDRDPALDVVFPITYFPGVTNSDAAAELDLAPGETADADISLQAVPSLHLRVTSVSTAKGDLPSFSVRTNLYGDSQIDIGAEWRQIDDETYELAGLPPQNLVIEAGVAGKAILGTRVLRVGPDSGDTVDLSSAPAGVPVSGRVVGLGGEKDSPSAEVIMSRQGSYNTAKMRTDGTFAFPPLVPATYEVNVYNFGVGEVVHSVTGTGAAITGRHIKIDGKSEVRLTVTMGRGYGKLTGFAQSDGKPFGGALILLVPESGDNPDSDARVDQSNTDGSFSLSDILPGRYVLLAFADGWDLEWKKPEILKPYLVRCQHVRVAAGETRNVAAEIIRKSD